MLSEAGAIPVTATYADMAQLVDATRLDRVQLEVRILLSAQCQDGRVVRHSIANRIYMSANLILDSKENHENKISKNGNICDKF